MQQQKKGLQPAKGTKTLVEDNMHPKPRLVRLDVQGNASIIDYMLIWSHQMSFHRLWGVL